MRVSSPASSSHKILSIATLIAILATLTANILSNFFPPQGLNIGAIANTILSGVEITPANYAFAIWGLIYLGLIAYGIYQLRPTQRSNSNFAKADRFLIVACIAQIAWVYLFTSRQFWLSVAAMLVILFSLIKSYLKLNIGKERVSQERKWFANIPFSIYLAWISVATIVNIASALYTSNWNGWGVSAQAWTAIMLVVGGVIAAIVINQRKDTAFALVYVWAYLAIAVRQWQDFLIWITALVIACLLIALLVFNKKGLKMS
jgi:hypothetical protein